MKVTIVCTESTLAKTGSLWKSNVVITDDAGQVVRMMVGGSNPEQAARWAEENVPAPAAKPELDLTMQWR
jgi:hypothetical protein